MPIPDLVYDVGMNNGDDTAHYLDRGCRVVAIEANPLLVEQARGRFAEAIAAGRLTILGCGVADRRATLRFFVNDDRHELSSFDPAMATKQTAAGHRITEIDVDCRPLVEILREHGTPHYLKIDVEGFDLHCLDAVAALADSADPADLPATVPAYVSVEAHELTPLYRLHGIGYRGFKCVNQLRHNRPPAAGQPSALATALGEARAGVGSALATAVGPAGRRLARKAGRRLGLSGRPHQPIDGPFPHGSSGPFGERTPGVWRTADEVAYDWLHLKLGHPHRGPLRRPGWFDFHARLSPPGDAGMPFGSPDASEPAAAETPR